MAELVIIGNGFDKAHGLRTDYKDFVRYIFDENLRDPKKFSNLFTFRGNPLGYNDLMTQNPAEFGNIISWPNIFFFYAVVQLKTNNWCDFENFYFDCLSGKLQHVSTTPDRLNKQFEEIKQHLYDYLIIQEREFKKIPWYQKYFSDWHRLRNDTLVLNFNYTNCIKAYLNGLSNIRHIQIHGELNNQGNPIIFGYAADDAECGELLDKKNNEYLRNIKKINYKRTNNEELLKQYLSNINEIKVSIFGHSCGISDKLILNQVLTHENVKSIRSFYHETYDDYFEKQVNINRITMNNTAHDKLVSFASSSRMPQYTDVAEEIKEKSYNKN